MNGKKLWSRIWSFSLPILICLAAFPFSSHVQITGPVVDGASALHTAVDDGNLKQARQLIEEGADVNAQDASGQTPLHRAVKGNNRLDLIWLLIDSGADTEVADNQGNTPLLLASSTRQYPMWFKRPDRPVVRWIKKSPRLTSWINSKFPKVIPKQQRLTTVELLLQLGADPKAVDTKGQSAMFFDLPGYSNRVNTNSPTHQLIGLLLAHGVDLESRDFQGNTPLHTAALSEHGREKFAALLDYGADPNATNGFGRTPFHMLSTKRASQDKVNLLLAHKVNLNVQDNNGDTPLHLALANWYDRAIQRLLTNGASIDIPNHQGLTPLILAQGSVPPLDVIRIPGATLPSFHGALLQGSRDEIQLWLDYEPNLIRLQFGFGDTPALIAARREDPDIIELIRSRRIHGPPINLQSRSANPFSESPEKRNNERPKWQVLPGDILAAAKFGELGTVMAAVEDKPELLKLSNKSETLLLGAVESGNLPLTEALLNAGADIYTSDNRGRTPLGRAFEYNYSELAALLLSKGATNDAHGFAAAGKLESLSELVQKDPAILARTNTFGHTPLHSAVFNGQIETVKWMQKEGVDLKQKTKGWGWSPLHCAVYAGQKDMMEWLLGQGANPTLVDRYQKNLLHEALITRHPELVERLIAVGVPINGLDLGGQTPLDYAMVHRSRSDPVNTFELIQKAGGTNGPKHRTTSFTRPGQ